MGNTKVRPANVALCGRDSLTPRGERIIVLGKIIWSRRCYSGHKAGVEACLNFGPINTRADKYNFLTTITPWFHPMFFDVSARTVVIWPTIFGDRGPPCAQRLDIGKRSGKRKFSDPIRACCDPEVTFGADNTGEVAIKDF